MERLHNWMRYGFEKSNFKSHPTDTMALYFSPYSLKSLSYKDALYYNARMIAEHFNGPFDVMLSGGIDSEVVVRVNHDLGIAQNVYVFRLEDNLNIRDVESAERICHMLGIRLNVVDFNASKWLDLNGEKYYKMTYTPKVEVLMRLGWVDCLDNIVITGNGEPYWVRNLKEDYSSKSTWNFVWNEWDFSIGSYLEQTGRINVADWYLFTPEITHTFHSCPVIANLLDDRLEGKLSSWSSRYEVYKDIWPTFEYKKKLVGLEGTNSPPGHVPEFFADFQNQVMQDATNTRFSYTRDMLENNFQQA